MLGKSDVRLILSSSTLEDLLGQLQMHKLDLILSNRPVPSDSTQPWRCKRIAQQSVCLVGPPSDTLRRYQFPQDLPKVKTLVPGQAVKFGCNLICIVNS